MAPEALGLNELTRITGAPSFAVLLKTLDELTQEFNSRPGSLEIIRTSDNKFRMQVRGAFAESVSHLAVDTDFSKALLRTLGLIAVRQPVRQSLVVRIIGNKAYDYVKELQQKGFLKATRQGNTKILEVTPRFESYFGRKADDIRKAAQGA